MACFVSGGNSSIELAWGYRDTLAFNHDRSSWLIDNFLRPEVPYRDGVPEFTTAHSPTKAKRDPSLPAMHPNTVRLFPQHTYETIPKLTLTQPDGRPTRLNRPHIVSPRSTKWGRESMRAAPPMARTGAQWRSLCTGRAPVMQRSESAPSFAQQGENYIRSGYLRDRDFTKFGSIQGEF